MLSLKLDRTHLPIKLVWGTVFNLLGRWCERRLEGRGFTQPQKVYGLLQSGDMNESYLLGLIERMEMTGSEIYAHPLAPTDDHAADDAARQENPGGACELQALISSRVREAIEKAGFRLATYESL